MNTVNVSNADPITLEVHDLLRAQGVAFTVSANRWRGLDFRAAGRIVRLAMEDEAYVRLYVFTDHRGEPGPLHADAHFANMPAGVIVATVAAYLA